MKLKSYGTRYECICSLPYSLYHVGSLFDYTDPRRSGDQNRTVKYHFMCDQVHF